MGSILPRQRLGGDGMGCVCVCVERLGAGLQGKSGSQDWLTRIFNSGAEGGQLQVLEWEGTCDKIGRGSWDI